MVLKVLLVIQERMEPVALEVLLEQKEIMARLVRQVIPEAPAGAEAVLEVLDSPTSRVAAVRALRV